MKWIVMAVLVAVLGVSNDIAKINRLKAEANRSYLQGDYKKALEQYHMLIDSFKVTEEEVLMNYAHAAYLFTRPQDTGVRGVQAPNNSGSAAPQELTDQIKNIAREYYARLAQNGSTGIRSMALNQLGVMTYQEAPPPKPGKEVLQKAQGIFKSALKADQQNENARFNYELVTKLLKQEQEQEQQQQQDQDQEQQEKDQEQQENQQQNQQDQQQQQQEQQQQSGEEDQEQSGQEDQSEKQEGEPKEQESQQDPGEQQEQEQSEKPLNASPEKMEDLKISEEKARMILEAMKNSEVQYIQQNQRKTSKRPDSGKPDW